MPFTVIEGTFHVVNYSPDGDSIRFGPKNPATLRRLDGAMPRVNARGHVQLRIEGIDTLETHYNPAGGGGTLRQPRALADAAADRLLDFLGVRNVVWNAARSTVVSADDGTPGFILSRSVEKNGRPVAFVFTGNPPADDGEAFRLEADFLERSYNLSALAEGLAYPTYYWGLFSDLRDAMTLACREARTARLGIHAEDSTNAGFDVQTVGALTDRLVILPKLFRRLTEYVVSTGTAVGFKEALAENREPVLHVPKANFTHFDTFVEQADGSSRIRLTAPPEDLVFDPMPARPTNQFAELIEEREVEMTMAALSD